MCYGMNRNPLWFTEEAIHNLIPSMVYRAISIDIKVRAIFLVDHPELCANVADVLGVSQALDRTPCWTG